MLTVINNVCENDILSIHNHEHCNSLWCLEAINVKKHYAE